MVRNGHGRHLSEYHGIRGGINEERLYTGQGY
nr:MAG TPA: hypothetical protein [Caudoviricetes sp.]